MNKEETIGLKIYRDIEICISDTIHLGMHISHMLKYQRMRGNRNDTPSINVVNLMQYNVMILLSLLSLQEIVPKLSYKVSKLAGVLV